MLDTFLCIFYVKLHSLNIIISKEHSFEVLIIKKELIFMLILKKINYLDFQMLMRSLKIADAVSTDPAPLPTTVTSSARSVLSVATFSVPSTAKGDPL